MTCQASAASVGSVTCSAGTPGCDGMLGLYCGGTKGARACAAVSYAADGAPCGTLADGSHVECIAGDCYTESGPAGAADLGICKGFASDGEACDTDIGPTCLSPARAASRQAAIWKSVCTVATGPSCD